MRNYNPSRHHRGYFRRGLLPNAGEYYRSQGMTLTGGGEWKSAICPFHQDTKPSLRIRLDSGGFRCMVCGAHGGDILSFHRKKYHLGFVEAAKSLGAWEVS